MKNTKDADNSNQSQKIIVELYTQVNNLRKKLDEEQKRTVEHNMQVGKFMHSMRKMERIIKECQKGSLEYLKYLNFYRSLEKELLDFLT